jgi:Spy/CpxP family protein refolding chaperone
MVANMLLKKTRVLLIMIFMIIPGIMWAQADRIAEELGLTAEQRESIKTLLIARESKMQSLETSLQIMQLELKQLIFADDLDAKQIRKKLEEISEIEVEIRFTRIEHEMKVMELLNDQQKQRYKFLRIKIFERRQKNNTGMNTRGFNRYNG